MEISMSNYPVLAIMSLFLGAFLNMLFGKKLRKVANAVVFVSMVVSFAFVIAMCKPVLWDGEIVTCWMGNWAPEAGWAYGIGIEVDALGLFFGLIVELATFVSGVYSFKYLSYDEELDSFYTLFLLLAGSVLGLVFTGDLFNMYVMVEIMTFTAVALTAFRQYMGGALEAAFKYLVVGSIGSTCLLIGIIVIYANLHTLNLAQIANLVSVNMNSSLVIAFGMIIIGFATKAFLFPFQPLAAEAHSEAPASVSLMISGVLTKCGVYGIIRFIYDIFMNYNEESVQILITLIGAVTMFICVTMAFNQHRFKRLLAFHSISQIGYVVTAIGLGTPLGLAAGLFHAINHTIFKGLLFLVAGAIQHETGTLDFDKLGGLSKKMPKVTLLFLIGAASISGIPLFNGFASKWMIYQAIYEKAAETGNFYYLVILVVALITSVLTLASFIKSGHSIFFGQLKGRNENVKDCPVEMRIPMWILAVLCIALGIGYTYFTSYVLQPAVDATFSPIYYISTMLLGEGFGAVHEAITYAGVYDPVNFLLLLVIMTCAVTVFSVRSRTREYNGDTSVDEEETKLLPEDSKYEPFFSGEESVYSHVGGADLFWGFKEKLKWYFKFWGNWHSGVINDYALYGTCFVVLVLIYCMILL